MSTELSPPPKPPTNPLRDSIRELRQGYQSVTECLELSMAECDLRAIELEDCRRQLAHARQSQNECEQRLARLSAAEAEVNGRCAALTSELAAKQVQLSEILEQLAHARAECVRASERLDLQVEQNQQLRHQMEIAVKEREALGELMAQLRSQPATAETSATETATLRATLALAQTELAQLREQHAAPAVDSALHEQLTAAEVERQQLESELDVLRNRGAELAEMLTEQKQAATQEREQWNDELRQLRRAVERQAEALVRRTATAPVGTPAPDPVAGRPVGSNGKDDNRVVGSVLAQFETLQKNKVRKVANS